jgi:hypothetical protein
MRYVVGRNRQAATGQLIISIIYLLINFIYLFVKTYFPDIPDQDAAGAARAPGRGSYSLFRRPTTHAGHARHNFVDYNDYIINLHAPLHCARARQFSNKHGSSINVRDKFIKKIYFPCLNRSRF